MNCLKYFIRSLFYKSNNLLKVKILNFFFKFYKINTKLELKNDIFCAKSKNKKIFFSIPERSLLFRKGLKYRLSFLVKKYFINKIKINYNDVIIDCGSNIGEFFFCFPKNLGINYYAFEPSPIVYQDLLKNIGNRKKIHLFNNALYFRSKIKKFYLLDQYADSSLIKIKNYKKIVSVKCVMLDDVIKNIKKKIKLIKIDAEGAEPEVLLGLQKYSSRVKYISVECGPERGVKLESTFKACKKILTKQNFRLIFSNKDVNTYLFKNIKFI